MIEIIPAMDIIGGRCVRLKQGDFAAKTEYRADPVDAALRFRDAGLARLHMVDLDGARTGRPRNLSVLESVAARSGLQIDFGGGVRAEADVEAAFSAGASMINVTSAAVHAPSTFRDWMERFGPRKFLLGADSRNGRVAANGWRSDTDVLVFEFVGRYNAMGIGGIFVTDIDRDGMLTGPDLDLYRDLASRFAGLELIASGGVRSISDIADLESAGCSAVIVGKALYEGRIKLSEVSRYVG